MNRTPRDVLIEAARLVRQGWTQGAAARATSGARVAPLNARAVRWCADGAIERASCGENPWAEAVDAIRVEVKTHLVAWNDAPGRTAEEVAQALERAAERCGT